MSPLRLCGRCQLCSASLPSAVSLRTAPKYMYMFDHRQSADPHMEPTSRCHQNYEAQSPVTAIGWPHTERHRRESILLHSFYMYPLYTTRALCSSSCALRLLLAVCSPFLLCSSLVLLRSCCWRYERSEDGWRQAQWLGKTRCDLASWRSGCWCNAMECNAALVLVIRASVQLQRGRVCCRRTGGGASTAQPMAAGAPPPGADPQLRTPRLKGSPDGQQRRAEDDAQLLR